MLLDSQDRGFTSLNLRPSATSADRDPSILFSPFRVIGHRDEPPAVVELTLTPPRSCQPLFALTSTLRDLRDLLFKPDLHLTENALKLAR